ncbi:MAG TPA: hypothetical protein DD636_09170 [Anaerolineaceae bacterium]|nr:hypothetical protein [Anaerolineaceae bacterium]
MVGESVIQETGKREQETVNKLPYVKALVCRVDKRNPAYKVKPLPPFMNTNVFITDRCGLSPLGLVAEPAFGWTSPPPQVEEGLKMSEIQPTTLPPSVEGNTFTGQ